MDKLIFFTIATITISFVLLSGDVLYIGLWYYIAIPAAAYLICLPFKTEKYFLSGIAVAIVLSYSPYIIHNLFNDRAEGLSGLGHISSLPGLYSGIIVGAIYQQHHKTNKLILFIIGLCVSLIGFLTNQFIICNTLLYCKTLIWPLSLFTLN